MPEELPRSSPIEHLRGLRETLLGLDKTTSPGTGGLRPEFLVTMAELMDANQMAQLEDFGLRYVRGDLPHWFYAVWLSGHWGPSQFQLRRWGRILWMGAQGADWGRPGRS